MSDSPAKKLDFSTENKENAPATMPLPLKPLSDPTDLKKPLTEIIKTTPEVKVAEGIKAYEADEPILQENPHRFVLFPIKYHEVRVSGSCHA